MLLRAYLYFCPLLRQYLCFCTGIDPHEPQSAQEAAQVLQLVSIYLRRGHKSTNTDEAEGAGMEVTSRKQMPRGTTYRGTKGQILMQKAVRKYKY